ADPGADVLLPARLGRVRRARRVAGAARPPRHRVAAREGIQRHARRLPARAVHGDAGPGRDVRLRPVGDRHRPGPADRHRRRPADLRALPRPGQRRDLRRDRRTGAARRLEARRRGAGGVRHRPGDRELLADAEAGRRPHRPAPGGGDLRGAGRRAAVRLPRHAAGPAGGGGGQRAAALRACALHPETPLRRADAGARHRGRTCQRRRHHRPLRQRRRRRRRRQGMSRTAAPAAAQLPLALRYPPDQRLDGFVAAPSGTLVQVEALATGRSGDWLYLVGAPASGKTHLALSACAAAEGSGRRSAYLPLAAAAGRLREALDALHDNPFIALDGLDAMAGGGEDELALFEFHTRARDAGIGVLYTARVAPGILPRALPDLRSRLSQCTRIALSPLDDGGRREVLRLRARRRGLAIDEASIDWLLRRVDRDLSSLTKLLDQLDRASLAEQRRITVPFLRQVLGGDANQRPSGV